jgi:sugar lactone lactonase YvrE
VKRFLATLSAAALAGTLALAAAGVALAAPKFPHTITLPGATSAEGIATGAGSTFYAGELFSGDIFRGDLRTGEVTRWIDAPNGRMATGIRVDEEHGLLFVAGAATGHGYVYDLATGAPVADFTFAAGQFINDVAVTGDAAWFTDSNAGVLFRVAITGAGSVGASSTLRLSGPAATVTPGFNLNGIAVAPNGTLLVAHTANGTVYTVDPATGASADIAGIDTPNVDGILFEAGRLFAVRNVDNLIVELRLSGDLTAATVVQTITDDAFEVPTTVARWGNRLAAVNAKFDTGFPPTADTFEVVEVTR